MFDMNQCEPGDKLLSVHGKILTYVRKVEGLPFPHSVRYPDGSEGSSTDSGEVFRKNKLDTDEDIVGFAEIPERLKEKKAGWEYYEL